MLGLLLLRHYSARAWTWPPLWWETGLLLLLNGFSLFYAGPLFQPWAAEILQKGGRRHISSDLYLFPGAGLLFQPRAAEILQKGVLQLDLNVASISASTCFFLWRRESALLLCKRIPLKIVYAWPPSIAPLQCKGLNFTSASVMGSWTASSAERLLLIYRWTPFPAMSGRDPPKRGPQPHQFRPLPFSRCWIPFPAVSSRDPPKRGPPPHQFRPLPFSRRLTPYWAVSGRDPPRRGAATWHQTCCHLVLLSAFATHRGCTTVSSLGSCPLCLSACQGCFLLADPFPETLFGIRFAEHTFHTRLA